MRNFLILVTFFLPIVGIIATFSLAIFFSGRKRWLVLFIIPLATFLIPELLIKYGGRYLDLGGGFIIPGLMLIFYLLGLIVYYPILIILAIVAWRKKKKSKDITLAVSIPPSPEHSLWKL